MGTRTSTAVRRLSDVSRRRVARRALAVRRPSVTHGTQPVTGATRPAVPVTRFRDVGRYHVENTLAEVAPTIRRLRHLLTVMVVSIPVAVVGGLLLLWRLGS
jgi:hypothetical protein